MFNFTKLWNTRYLFGPNLDSLSRSDLIFFWVAMGFIILAIAAKIIVLKSESASPKRFFYNRFFHLLLTTGLLTALWFGFRFENIPWLGTHIVVLAWWLIAAVWLGFIIAYFFRDHRPRQKLWEEEKIKRKYLP